MSTDKKTHWKKNFDYNYLGAYSLNEGQEITLTIQSVKKEVVTIKNGQKEDCTLCIFKENVNGEKKPMILNKTNCKVIQKLYNTPFIEEWVNKRITLYVDNNVQAFGDVVDALRIKQIAPPIKKPDLNPTSPKWETAKERVKEGMTYSDISKHYNVSQSDYDLLCG